MAPVLGVCTLGAQCRRPCPASTTREQCARLRRDALADELVEVFGHHRLSFRITHTSRKTRGVPGLVFELVHVTTIGSIDGSIPVETQETGEFPPQNCCNVYGETRITVAPVADYDGDGEAELYVGVLHDGDEGHHVESHAIYTYHGGIAKLPATLNLPLVGVRDFDHDGLEDLDLAYFVGTRTGACTGFGRPKQGPLLLAHARPDGTFPLDDEVARRAARAASSSKPASFEGGHAACARVWGVDQSTLDGWFDGEIRRCRSSHPLSTDAGCSEIDADPCHPDDVARAYAKVTPPLTL